MDIVVLIVWGVLISSVVAGNIFKLLDHQRRLDAIEEIINIHAELSETSEEDLERQ